MCKSHRTEFRCKHFREQISPHNLEDGRFAECKDIKANVTLKQNNSHDCPRCSNAVTPTASSRACVNRINGITTGLSGMQVSARAPGRPSALYAEKVRLVVAAKLARRRATQATNTAPAAAAAAAAATAAAAKQPVQAGTPPTSRASVATRSGAPVGTTNARAAGGRSAGGAPAAAATAAAAARVPTVRGGQVPAKVQGRVVVPGTSRA